MSSLREAIAQAIFSVKYGPTTRSGAKAWDEQPAYVRAAYLEEADAVLVVVRRRIEALPADYDSDWFGPQTEYLTREHVLEALGGSDE